MFPTDLAIAPRTNEIEVPVYDYNKQSRWDEPLKMGKYTSASLQTFDSKGQPKDSQADNND